MSLRCDVARQILIDNGYTHKWVPYSSRALTIYGVALALFIGMGIAELICKDHCIETRSPSGFALKGIGGFLGVCAALFLLNRIKHLDEAHEKYDAENEKALKVIDDNYQRGSNAMLKSEHVTELRSFTDEITQKMLGLRV